MKKKNGYLLVLILFLILMSIVLYFFMIKNEETTVLNKAKSMLGDLYQIDAGEYYLKDGILYTKDNYIIGNKKYFDGNGDIVIDKYKNVKFLINYKEKCISKTSVGNINIEDNKCGDFKKIDVSISRNNSVISFSSNVKNLEYKISNKDDFSGIFIKEDYEDNIVIKSYNEGKNYIWFKDQDGNISDAVTFNVDCLSTNKAKYDKTRFYCSGSTVILDNYEWVVLKDSNSNIKLMKLLPLDNKMNQCEECDNYTWSKSLINKYLNTEFLNKLSNETKDSLIGQAICDDFENTNCGDEICGGFTKEEIEGKGYSCSLYTSSKIKIVSYFEFNYAYSYAKNKSVLEGNYWAINSFEKGNGSSIQYNLDFYVLENYKNKLDVKPVITLSK